MIPFLSEVSRSEQSMIYRFRPSIEVVGKVPGVAPISNLSDEIGVYSATPEFIRANCGPIANSILDAVPDSYHDEAAGRDLTINCDIRIHRLYPGDFPAYPGWHCDGEYRETYFAQPDLSRIRVHKHLVATVSSHEYGVSNTEFLAEPFDFDSARVSADHGLWQQVNEALEAAPTKRVTTIRDGELTCFDSWTLHRAAPAKIRGWRLFFRASMWHKPGLGDGGMVTKQEQVYKYVGHYGW